MCLPLLKQQYKKAKTDQIDSYRLAQLLRGGFLKPVFHDGSEREKLRIIVLRPYYHFPRVVVLFDSGISMTDIL